MRLICAYFAMLMVSAFGSVSPASAQAPVSDRWQELSDRAREMLRAFHYPPPEDTFLNGTTQEHRNTVDIQDVQKSPLIIEVISGDIDWSSHDELLSLEREVGVSCFDGYDTIRHLANYRRARLIPPFLFYPRWVERTAEEIRDHKEDSAIRGLRLRLFDANSGSLIASDMRGHPCARVQVSVPEPVPLRLEIASSDSDQAIGPFSVRIVGAGDPPHVQRE